LQFRIQGKKNFEKFFDKSVIVKIGKQSGFTARKCKKISSFHFVLGFIISCSNGKNTFSDWAAQIGWLNGKSLSKQAVFDRIHDRTTVFAKQLLEHALLQISGNNFDTELFASFGKVVLHDSTTLRLPQVLSSVFPGSRNQHGGQKAIARIQSMFDIKAMRFMHFSLSAFTKNDQSSSGSVIQQVSSNDLVIRDLGYFSIAVFEKLIATKVHILSRLKYGVTISDSSGKLLSLKSLLKQKAGVDRWVFIGSERKVWVRLVMIPLPAKQAAEKIRRAKHDRDRRMNHDTAYYNWLRFNTYITTVHEEVWSTNDVNNAYKIRWQIEIIFKSWKSGFHLQHILHEGCTNENRVRVAIYLILLFTCLFIQKIYIRYKKSIERNSTNRVSLLKLSCYIINNIQEVFSHNERRLKENIRWYCCYEKRTDRVNLTDLYQKNKN
jgi:hypothetical protein